MAHLAAFICGQTVQLRDGRLGQIMQVVFQDGQWRYCISVGQHKPFVWEWEGFLRSEGSAIHGR